jgi:3-oxoacyl-[acyl-carrier protein] reductase
MSEDRKLTGKVAMVFGGSRGLGAAAARRPAREGANVGLNLSAKRSLTSNPCRPEGTGSSVEGTRLLLDWNEQRRRLGLA